MVDIKLRLLNDSITTIADRLLLLLNFVAVIVRDGEFLAEAKRRLTNSSIIAAISAIGFPLLADIVSIIWPFLL